MAITYSAGTGTTITSYAHNSTLGDQTQQTGNNTVVLANTLANSNNGQIGTRFPTYVGRLIVVNLGLSSEQIRRCNATTAGTGTTQILTVSENWVTNPVSGDTVHVFYDIDDVENGGAGNGISFNLKTGLYEFTNVCTLGNGTAAAGLQLVSSTGLEISDEGQNNSFIINNNGFFICGFSREGTSISGGVVTSVVNANGENTFLTQAGSRLEAYDSLFWSQRFLSECIFTDGSLKFYDSKIINFTLPLSFSNVEILNSSINGKATASENINITSSTVIDGLVLSDTNGFFNTSGTSLTLKNVVWANNLNFININSNETWDVINPVWSVTTHTDLTWITSTNNRVNSRRSVDVLIAASDTTPLADAVFVIYEGTQTQNLEVKTLSNASGIVATSFIYRAFITNSSTVTYGNHVVRTDKWLYSPFITAISSVVPFETTVVLSDDTFISETNQSTALSTGSTAGVTWNEETNSSSVIYYTAGTGTLNVNDTITGGTSGATGVVTQILSGSSTAGYVHLKTRNGTAFSTTETISNGAGWSATKDSAYQERRFKIWIDSKNISVQNLYNYLAALTSQTTLSATGELIHEWGLASQARALYTIDGNSFFTNRSSTKGVIAVNLTFDSGDFISFFESDSGTTYTPPAQYSFSLTGLKNGSEIRIYNNSTSVEIAGVEDMTNGIGTGTTTNVSVSGTSDNNSFTYTYEYTGSDIQIFIVIVNLQYQIIRLDSNDLVLTNESKSIPITQVIDRNYSDPNG